MKSPKTAEEAIRDLNKAFKGLVKAIGEDKAIVYILSNVDKFLNKVDKGIKNFPDALKKNNEKKR